MESRLDESSLTLVLFALAGEETFPKQELRTLERHPFVEIILMCDQNVFDVVGMIEQIEAIRPESEVRDVAMIAGDSQEKVCRRAAEGEQLLAGPTVLRARRECYRSRHEETVIPPPLPCAQREGAPVVIRASERANPPSSGTFSNLEFWPAVMRASDTSRTLSNGTRSTRFLSRKVAAA